MSRKDQIRNILNKHASLFHAFIFLLAIFMAALGAVSVFTAPIWRSIYSNVMSSIAAALMVVAILFILRRFFLADQGESKEVIVECKAKNLVFGSDVCGLEKVYDKRGNFGSQRDWITLIDEAVEKVDLMGRALYGWTQSSETVDVIVKKVINDNVSFRWLFMHRDNKFLPAIIEEDVNIGAQLTTKLEEVCKLLLAVQERLPKAKKKNFQIRQFKNVPLYFSLLRIDDNVFINQYLFSANSDNSPLLHLKGLAADWTSIYLKEFETIWKMAEEPQCLL